MGNHLVLILAFRNQLIVRQYPFRWIALIFANDVIDSTGYRIHTSQV